ncbi:DUF11 domain-containing protein [Humibacillus xanthopallidus]|uniref:COG1361 S-layer family protein n=1 Tax=Humibacillus xanthopallidus TaxID=412689 RepID=UPI00385083EB
MTRRLVPRLLAVSMVAALLPMTVAQADPAAPSTAPSARASAGHHYVSPPFAGALTTKPLKAMDQGRGVRSTDPGEGLGRGRLTAKTKPTAGQKDPLLKTQSGAGVGATAGEAPSLTEAVQELTAPLVSFVGQGGANPPDPNGDVGPGHYVQMVNSTIQVWDKQGASLLGPTAINQIWVNATTAGTGFDQCRTQNAGDPIVLYDQQADRFMISQFTSPSTATGPGGTFPMCIAYSQTGDPTLNWFVYQFNLPASHDYMKYGIWPDGLYMSTYEGGSVGAYVFDRSQMISGSPATFQAFTGLAVGAGVDGRETRTVPADWDGDNPPAPGAPNPFAMSFDGAVDGGNDRIEISEFHVDWATPANSTFTLATTLNTAAFDTDLNCVANFRDCIPQPGTATRLDSLSNRLMARLQYRNFGTHESMVINQTVDSDGADRAGVRWYELRDTGAGWSIYQQGTYAPVDGIHRWMAAAAMDGQGNIALGYTASDGTSTFPGLRYTARLAGEPLGAMTQPEQVLANGTTAETSNRWGDYAGLVVDPVDECTFWFTGERDNSATSIGSFRLPSCLSADLRLTKTDAPDPVAAGQDVTYTLTATNDGPATAEDVTVTDTLPAGVTLISAPGCILAAGVLTCNVGQLLAGQSVVVAVQVHVPADFLGAATSGLLTNTASVAAADQTDPNPGNNTVTATTTVLARADLAVTKVCKPDSSAPAGTQAFCDIHVDNLGPSDAVDVTLTDVLTSATGFNVVGASVSPGGVCVVPPQGAPVTTITVTCDLGTEPAGGRTTIRVTVTSTDTAEINDVATVTSPTPDPNSGNNQAIGKVVFSGSADLAVTKSGLPAVVVAGETLTYTIGVTNNGPSTAVATVLTDRLPAGLSFVSVSSTVGSCTYPQPVPGTLTCNLGSLASGASATITVVTRVAPDVAPGTILANVAVVSSATSDPSNANNQVTVDNEVSALADVSVTKTDSPDPVLAGNPLSYTIKASNAGPSTAQSVLVTDTLPDGTSFVTGVDNNGQVVCTLVQTATVECAVGTLQPGQTATIQLTVKVDASLAPGTVLENVAVVSSATPDPAAGNNTATATTTVATRADVWLDKQAVYRSGNPSPALVYTLVVHNDPGCETDAQSTQTPTCGTGGPSDATGITVTDTLPLTNKKLVVQYVSPQCTYTKATHTVTCTSARVPAGTSVTFVIEAQVSGSVGNVLNTASVTSTTPDLTLANNTNAASVVIKGGTGKK